MYSWIVSNNTVHDVRLNTSLTDDDLEKFRFHSTFVTSFIVNPVKIMMLLFNGDIVQNSSYYAEITTQSNASLGIMFQTVEPISYIVSTPPVSKNLTVECDLNDVTKTDNYTCVYDDTLSYTLIHQCSGVAATYVMYCPVHIEYPKILGVLLVYMMKIL